MAALGVYAQVVNNTITNTVSCDAAFASAHGLIEIDQLSPVPGIGWTLLAGTWTPPTPDPTLAVRNTLNDRAFQAIQANINYLAIGTPTNAQVVAQVNVLTKECTALIRVLLGALDSTSGA